MDLARYARVLARFRWLVAGGLLLAVLLTVASVATIGPHGLKWRKGLRYHSSATIFITQPGFPWGRANDLYLPGNSRDNQPSTPVGDPQRMASLTSLYAQLAMTDPVRQQLTASDRRDGQLFVHAVAAPAYQTPAVLPLLKFEATSSSPGRAEALANASTSAFQRWLSTQQNQAGIKQGQRVVAQVVSSATPAKAVTKHSKSLPIAIFLAVVAATLGLALTLENVRPQGDTVAGWASRARQPEGRAAGRQSAAGARGSADGDASPPAEDVGSSAHAVTLALADDRVS